MAFSKCYCPLESLFATLAWYILISHCTLADLNASVCKNGYVVEDGVHVVHVVIIGIVIDSLCRFVVKLYFTFLYQSFVF